MHTTEWIFFRHLAPKILALRKQSGRFFVQSAKKISHSLAHPDLISVSLSDRKVSVEKYAVRAFLRFLFTEILAAE